MSKGESSVPPNKKSVPIIVAPSAPDSKLCILKFNKGTTHDVDNLFVTDNQVRMERDDNRKLYMNDTEQLPEFGAGSEYGRAAREEARRKKLGRRLKNYILDNQPWKMTINKKERENGTDIFRKKNFKTIREGGANSHTDFWVFVKNGDHFIATCVDEFYNVMPCVPFKTFDIDEAEAQFQIRDQLINKFALKAQLQKKKDEEEEDDEVVGGGKSGSNKSADQGLKIKDEASDDSDGHYGEDDDIEGKTRVKKKKKNNDKGKKDKKIKVSSAFEVAKYESDDGDDEGREYDYMSDSGSDTDKEDVPDIDKIEGALVGVGDEDGLRKIIDSDESSDEDLTLADKEDESDTRDKDKDDSNDDDSEFEDADIDKESETLFKYKGLKRPASSSDLMPEAPVKKTRDSPPPKPEPEGENTITEEAIRNVLRRGECCTKELIHHFRSTVGINMEKQEIASVLAQHMQKFNLHKRKEKIKGKTVLFFKLIE
ncbi:General transcription factor IIF subunit 1 [Strongyloides ratti]|uniref:Transcription initiation factor IIF subunit alpha n=1 Tax=Strongyloides ratti TaxID=34506 RepID=A0A090L2J0_STRRB|nr:General transcription factor IIF subunit 1 [Strongyloides ratti]CEF62312.1 General transcription factor IIF subunit 1 [Strongyloides ratti]